MNYQLTKVLAAILPVAIKDNVAWDAQVREQHSFCEERFGGEWGKDLLRTCDRVWSDRETRQGFQPVLH